MHMPGTKHTIHTYSCRAECELDIHRGFAILRDLDPAFRRGYVKRASLLGVSGPDHKLEFHSALPLHVVRTALNYVPDAHVMRQSLRPCKLVDNSLERDDEIN
jgi:hypothetical protein